MDALAFRRCVAVMASVLFWTVTACCDGSWNGPPRPSGLCDGGGCGACGDAAYRVYRQSNYKPPSYHLGVPFGYYPTLWTRWPTAGYSPLESRPEGPRGSSEPEVEPLPFPTPIRPDPDVEPLPAPRPLDMTRLFGGPRLPDLLPPGQR